MNKIAKQAVISGASIAGLSAARVLSDYFDEVIIIEREIFPESPLPRKAVPQGQHVHALLKGGELALESLFPGFAQDVMACGGVRIDFSKDIRWFHGAYWKVRHESHFEIMVQTRPLLEHVIRQQVRALPNVKFYFGYEIEHLLTDTAKSRVNGVLIQDMETRSKKQELACDFFVDASGRGAKTSQWLEALGYRSAEETRIKVDLSYASRAYKAPEAQEFDWKLLGIYPLPDNPRGGWIFPVENKQWLVSFFAYSGEALPQNNDEFVEYAKGLAHPDIYELIQDLEPIGNVKTFSTPYTIRRHYERAKLPARMLVMGDAFCAFDPAFGQGMTVAVMEAAALAELIARNTNLDRLGERFHKEASKIVDVPWMLTGSEDFQFPKTTGKRPLMTPVLQWYSRQLYRLCGTDTEVYDAFRQVMHLLEGPELLFQPRILFKVLKQAFAQ